MVVKGPVGWKNPDPTRVSYQPGSPPYFALVTMEEKFDDVNITIYAEGPVRWDYDPMKAIKIAEDLAMKLKGWIRQGI